MKNYKEKGYNKVCGGYGTYIILKHNDGTFTRYNHFSQIFVKKGEKVKKRSLIGLSGNTGVSQSPHLDFKVYCNNNFSSDIEKDSYRRDPLHYLPDISKDSIVGESCKDSPTVAALQKQIVSSEEETNFEEEGYAEDKGSSSCSTNTECTGFAQNNCDAPQNVRCGKDGLCHCCLTLCPGGENCKCIDCSTGCGGGTYCEGDACVFETGGYPNDGQMAKSEDSYARDYYTQESAEENGFALSIVPIGGENSVYQKVFESDGAYRSRRFVLGTIKSSPAGIDCSNFDACNALFSKDALVTLTATASNGAKFSGWYGACSGTGSCSVKMDSDKEVIAIFDPEISVTIQSAVCSPRKEISGGDVSASGSATGATGVVLSVIPGGLSLSCGSWRFDGSSCIRGSNDPQTTSWSFQNYYTPFT